MLNFKHFIQGEIIEVNDMLGGKNVGLCRINAKEDEVNFITRMYLFTPLK